MTALLPVLRSVAEAEEHDYDRAATEFDTTFTMLKSPYAIHRQSCDSNSSFSLLRSRRAAARSSTAPCFS